jgi:hypothetical protein
MLNVEELKKALEGIAPNKEVVVVADHAYNITFVTDCRLDCCVMLQCKTPREKSLSVLGRMHGIYDAIEMLTKDLVAHPELLGTDNLIAVVQAHNEARSALIEFDHAISRRHKEILDEIDQTP